MQNRRNYYRILHVQPDAPVEIIRTAYRTMMQRLKMHPDLGGDVEMAALINQAFATLSDPAKRAAYDRQLAARLLGLRARQSPRSASDAARSACTFCGEPHAVRESTRRDARCKACHSPLFLAAFQGRTLTSRRAFERLERTYRITCDVPEATTAFKGVTEDISIAGARFTSSRELTPGQIVRIDCDFCTAVGIVKRVDDDANRGARAAARRSRSSRCS